jgi:hypothetical protein
MRRKICIYGNLNFEFNKMTFLIRIIASVLFIAIFVLNIAAQSMSTQVPSEWQTYAEKTNYQETPRYAETIEFCKRLAAASPLIHYTTFGKSGELRDLPLVIAARDTFTPEAARAAGKPIVLVQAGIHAGEIDGKDAGLALLRDIAITKTRTSLLDHVVVLFIPIYNVDGHERVSPYNRINQNGPKEMGFRANATNLNLNRDYMKADAPETRAWLKLWNEWQPDLFIDCHVTDGADFRYNVTYQFERHETAPRAIREWEVRAIDERAVPATEREGNLLAPYLEFRDNRDLAKGIDEFIATPRYSTAYVPLRNRPALLIETHMLKDYRTRVKGTYNFVRAVLEEINRDPQSLLRAVSESEKETIEQGSRYDAAKQVALRLSLTDKAMPFQLKGVEYKRELSAVSGAVRVAFDSSKPLDLTVPFYNDARVASSVSMPLYYIVPPQWTSVIEVLKLHGLRLQKLAAPLKIEVESYRLRDVQWANGSFEGHVLVSFKTEKLRETREFPAGSIVVPLNQAAARVAVNLLEPDAPDSLAVWGFFDSILEQKEFGESYVVEKLAREMMAKDENLRREFERRVLSDPKFAANPRARLNFFYERSPYFDRQIGLYPVGRIIAPLDAKTIDLR